MLVAGALLARGLPLTLWLCTVTVHMTVPLLILAKGNQSAIYLIDLMAPLLVLYVLNNNSTRPAADVGMVTTSVCTLLLVMPFIAGGMAYAIGNAHMTNRREAQETLLWLARNLVFVSVFLFGTRQRIDGERVLAFIKLVLLSSAISAAFGMLSYFGSVNLAAFEMLSAQKDVQWTTQLSNNRIGSGFLGLFRAAVGQWYVCVVLLAVSCFGVLKPAFRLVAIAAIALGIGVILLSYSRAGVVGLLAGLVTSALLGGGRAQKFTAIMAMAMAGIWLWLQSDLVSRRLESIVTADDVSSQSRLHIWKLSFDLLTNNPSLLLSGVGPANHGAVYELIGVYGAHNEYIDIIYRMGIMGVLILFGTLLLIARALWVRRQLADVSARAFSSGMLAVLVSNCVMALTQDHLIHDYSGHAVGVFVYFLYGMALSLRTEPMTQSSPDIISTSNPCRFPNLMGSRMS